MTPRGDDKIRVMNNADDYGLDDLSSADDTDDEDNPRKVVPSWATKDILKSQISRQYWSTPDPAIMFKGCYAATDRKVDFHEIFRKQLKNNQKRLEKISVRRETSLWNSPMKDAAPLLDRTLALDQSCFPPEEPRTP
jgi:hypothetical protein